jgi:hypothetical protein
MLPHEHNEILTKEEFCQRLLDAVHALEPLNRSWYAASRPLMQRSDKDILEAIFNVRYNLNVLLLTLMLVAAGSFPISLAQNQSSQPVDPTAQSPSTLAPTPTATAPLDTDQETGRSFVGTIAKRRHAYVLKAADGEYLLTDSAEAKKYKGKRVKVTGDWNQKHVIRVEMIQLSPPL